MEKDKLNWYSYLTEEFRRPKDSYTVNDKAVFDCPRCKKTKIVRINHAKEKIKKLGFYECAPCRKRDAIIRARKVYFEKHNGVNPFSLQSVKDKIKQTNIEKYGVSCILSKPEIYEKGVNKASKFHEAKRKYKADFSKISVKFSENKKEWRKQYNQIRRFSDPSFTPRRAIYNALKRMLKGQYISATCVLYDIGYTAEQLRTHIESKFMPGMSWDNHGKWHLDHKIPLTAFDCTDLNQIKIANALSNLQPLWASDNIRKRNKY